MAFVRQSEYLTIPGEGIDLENLHQGVARHLDKLRQTLYGSRAAQHVDSRPVLAELGLLLACCPPVPFTPPEFRTLGLGSQGTIHVPVSPLEEATLCLLLALAPRRGGGPRYLHLAWPTAFVLGLAGCPRYLAHAFSGLALSQRKHAQLWLVLSQALLASGQAAKAKLALQSLEAEVDGGPLPALLRVKANLEIGASGLVDAVRSAREAVDAAGPGSPLEGKAQQALGVALAAAATRPGVLPSGERAAALEAALEALQHASRLDPGDPLTLYHLGLVKAEARQLDEAADAARGALAASGGTLGPAWALLALVVSAQQRVGPALEIAREGLREADPCEHLLLQRIQARLLIAAGEPDEAVQSLALFLAQLQEAATSNPPPTAAQAKVLTAAQGDLWLELARTFLAKAAPADAMECVERALEFAPWSASVHHVKGRVLVDEGDVEGAACAFATALSLDTHHAKSLLMLGRLHRKRNGAYDHALAQTFVRQGLRSEALRNVGWYNAGLLMRKERRWEEAEKSLRTAVGLALTAPVMSFHKLPRPL